MSSGYCDPYVPPERQATKAVEVRGECPHHEDDSHLYELPNGKTALVCSAIRRVELTEKGYRPKLCWKVLEVFEHRCPQCSRVLEVSRVGPGVRSLRCGNGCHDVLEVAEVRA